MLEKIDAEKCPRKVLQKSFVEKCRRRMLQLSQISVGEECCREVLGEKTGDNLTNPGRRTQHSRQGGRTDVLDLHMADLLRNPCMHIKREHVLNVS